MFSMGKSGRDGVADIFVGSPNDEIQPWVGSFETLDHLIAKSRRSAMLLINKVYEKYYFVLSFKIIHISAIIELYVFSTGNITLLIMP